MGSCQTSCSTPSSVDDIFVMPSSRLVLVSNIFPSCIHIRLRHSASNGIYDYTTPRASSFDRPSRSRDLIYPRVRLQPEGHVLRDVSYTNHTLHLLFVKSREYSITGAVTPMVYREQCGEQWSTSAQRENLNMFLGSFYDVSTQC